MTGCRQWLLGKVSAKPSPAGRAVVDDPRWKNAHRIAAATAGSRPTPEVTRDRWSVQFRVKCSLAGPLPDRLLLSVNGGLTGVALIRTSARELLVRAVLPTGHLAATDVEAVTEAVLSVAAELPRRLLDANPAIPAFTV